MKVKTKLRLEQEKILHDDLIVKRSQRFDHFYEQVCQCLPYQKCNNYCTSKIGFGLNGSIKICKNRKTNQLVAVKQVKSTPRAGHEITLHYLVSKKSRQNIVQILDIFLNTDSRGESWFYVVLEYCKDGDLFKLLKSKPNGFIESDIFYLARQIVDILKILQVLGIAHCDVKPENILIDYDSQPEKLPKLKLADFGFARDVNQPNNSKKLLMYTPNYVAPEVLAKRDYGLPCDVWALGVIMFVMATGHFPDVTSEKEIILQLKQPKIEEKVQNQKVQNNKNQKFKKDKSSEFQISDCLLDLFQRIFVIDPKSRITISEIMNHEWWMRMTNKKIRKLKKQKSSENSPNLSACSSVIDENNNSGKKTKSEASLKSGVNSKAASQENLNQTMSSSKVIRGEKYTWSESDILKSLALDDNGSDNGSEKARSGKSSRSSRKRNNGSPDREPDRETERFDDFGSDDSSEIL